MGAVAGAEPAAKVAGFANGHAAEVGADACLFWVPGEREGGRVSLLVFLFVLLWGWVLLGFREIW